MGLSPFLCEPSTPSSPLAPPAIDTPPSARSSKKANPDTKLVRFDVSPPHTNGRAADRRQKLGTTPLVSSPHDLTFVVHFFKKNNTQTTPDRTVDLRNRPNQPFSPFFVFLVVVEEQTTTTTTLLHRSSHFCLCSFFAWNPLNSLFPGLRCLPADLARPSPVGVGGETRKGTQKKRQKNQSDEERAVFLLFSPPAPRLLLQTVSANHSTANATESSLTHLLRSLLLCRCRRRVGG